VNVPARLIVNADDLGLTPGINRVVAELHRAGAVTSATLMASGPAFDDAVRMLRQNPGLGIGCHLVLTDGVPVSSPESIPSLIGADGRSFRASLPAFLVAVLRGQISEEEIAREALAQIGKLQRAGIRVTHLDTHKHTHILPGVARPLLRAAEQSGVRAIRNPFEDGWSLRLGRGGRLRPLQVALMRRLQPGFFALEAIRQGRIATTDGTLGISATGGLDGATLRQLMEALPDGIWELVCHPGANDRDLDAIRTRLRATREVERDALLEVLSHNARRNAQPPALELIHYGELDNVAPIPDGTGRHPVKSAFTS
jgi:chitin disaccharide deacetylase